jgi:hypothetical protein
VELRGTAFSKTGFLPSKESVHSSICNSWQRFLDLAYAIVGNNSSTWHWLWHFEQLVSELPRPLDSKTPAFLMSDLVAMGTLRVGQGRKL